MLLHEQKPTKRECAMGWALIALVLSAAFWLLCDGLDKLG